MAPLLKRETTRLSDEKPTHNLFSQTSETSDGFLPVHTFTESIGTGKGEQTNKN